MIYTLTFHRALNYGAALQCYALVKYLNNIGCETKCIDYVPKYFAWQIYRPAKSIGGSIKKFKKIQKFAKFRKKFIPLTENTYFSLKGLSRLEPADAVVCGSDQIWNYNITGGRPDPVFFLDFINDDSKRVAYAASAGSIRFEGSVFSEQIFSYLSEYHSIGVRELQLQKDIQMYNKGLVSPHLVLDPSLLIDDYTEVINDELIPKFEYLVTYVVGSGETLEKFELAIDRVKELTNLKIVHIGSNPIRNADLSFLDIGPSEWLSFIKNAAFVVTNSFHGTAFSVNFEKDFLILPHYVPNLNSRQETLLNGIGLAHRMKAVNELPSEYDLQSIDFTSPRVRLLKLKEESKMFLKKSIN